MPLLLSWLRTLRRQTALTLMCCESVCGAMSCGGGFTPGGAYDSVWDSVKLMTEIPSSIISSTKSSSGVCAC